MPEYISVCKNVIASNNKRKWENPEPAIRISSSPSGKATKRAHNLAIKDKDGNIVALIMTTTDGKPVIKCGAKVAIVAYHPTQEL